MPALSKNSTFISKDGLFIRLIHKNTQNDHKNSSPFGGKISILEMNSIMDFIFDVLYAV